MFGVPEISVAQRAGVGLDGADRPSEDRVVVLDNAVVVLDGATAARPDLPSGGWYAELLASALEADMRARTDVALTDLLARSINTVSQEHHLQPGHAPSSTVAILRWNASHVDGLVLADSPVVAFGRSNVSVLADDRLDTLRQRGRLTNASSVDTHRNVQGGFWVAETDPTAAYQAKTMTWERAELDAVLLATDGVTVGVDPYGLFDWPRARTIVRQQGVYAVLDAVRAAERADPACRRWPRAKRHDDQTLAMVEFGANSPDEG